MLIGRSLYLGSWSLCPQPRSLPSPRYPTLELVNSPHFYLGSWSSCPQPRSLPSPRYPTLVLVNSPHLYLGRWSSCPQPRSLPSPNLQCCGSGSGRIRTFFSDPDPTIKSHITRSKSNKLNRYFCEQFTFF